MTNIAPTLRFSQNQAQESSQATTEILSQTDFGADYEQAIVVNQELSAEIARLIAENERLKKPCQSKVDGKKFLEENGYQNVSLADGVKVYTGFANKFVAENKDRAISLAREIMSSNIKANQSGCCHKL